MARDLEVLILEDQPSDVALMVDALRRQGFDLTWERVETKEAYVAHLRPDLDVIVADYALPQLDAMEALRLLQARNLDIPFLVVAGATNGEDGVACLKQGADDYLLKDRLERLGPAVENVMQTRRLRDERRATRRNAHISARQWQATFDAISDPLFLLDAGGRIVRCNQATLDFTELARTEIVGRSCCKLLHGVSEPIEGCPYTRALETQGRASLVWQKDDRWLEGTVDPVLDDDGYLIGFVYLLEDITKERQAEQAVRRHARELELLNRAGQALNASLDLDKVLGAVLEEVRRVLDVTGCSVWLRDPISDDLVCRQASGPQGDIVRGWRLPPGEGLVGWAVGHGKSSIVGDTQEDERHLQDVDEQTGLGLRSILTVPLHSDEDTIGALQAVDEEVDSFEADDAALLRSLATSAALAIEKAQAYERAQDEIAERRRAEEKAQLRASLLDAVGEAVMATDRTGKVIYWNQAAEDLYGWSAEEVLGRNLTDVAPALGSEERATEIMERLRAGERWTGEFPAQRQDGTTFHALVTNTPVQDEGGKLTAIIGVSRDITRRLQAEQALERRAVQQRAINEFAISLAAAESATDYYALIAEELRAITGAVGVSVSVYDEEKRSLVVKHVAADSGMISRLNDLLDWEIAGLHTPVSEEMYAQMAEEVVRTVSDLSEITFGRVPKPVAAAVQCAFGVDRFIGLALTDRCEVMGTAVIVFKSGQASPSNEVLQTFARVAAASLRQRQAEESLRRVSQERQLLLDLVPVGITIIDEEGQIIEANRMSEEVLGIPVAEQRQRRHDGEEWEIIRLDGTPMPAEEYASVRAMEEQEIVRNAEMGMVSAKDETTWVSVSAAPIPLEGYGVAIAYADVTTRKLVEEALRESERRFRQTFEHAASGMAIIDPDGCFLQVNQRFCDILGYSHEELIGQGFQTVTHPRDREAGLQVFRAQLAGRLDHEEFEKRLIRRDGRVVWTLISTAMLRDSQGDPLYQISQIQDLSKRKEAERALRQRVRELTLLNEIGNKITRPLGLDMVLESAAQIVQSSFGYDNVTILTLDRERERLVVRATAGDPVQVVPEDTHFDLGEGITGWATRHAETVLANDVEADPRYVSPCPRESSSRSKLSVPICKAEDVVGVLDIQSERLGAFNENDVMVMETVADQIAVALENARLYEAEHAARQQLRDLASYLQNTREEERTRIAREIHDEFGQMITALKMDLSWLIKRLPQDEPELSRKADAMSETIDETLYNVRRISSELRPGILDDLGLAAAIEWQAETFSERSGILCELDLDEEGDDLDRQLATALFRILQEALTNVARHADASWVRVDLDVEPREVTLTVEDDGRGITQAELTDVESLGLMGMRERARALGGALTLEGRPSAGTTVIARIPRQPHESHP